MMIQYKANTNALLSGLIWNLIFSTAVKTSMGFITNAQVSGMVWYGGNIVAMILYPALVSYLLRKQTGLWINVCFFSLLGALLSVLVLYLVGIFLKQAWTDLAVFIVIMLFTAWKIFPFIKHNYALASERESPHWEMINDLSLVDFLFCRFMS